MRCVLRHVRAGSWIVPAMFLLPQFGSVTRELGDVATIVVPRKASLEKPRGRVKERPTWIGFRMDRGHPRAVGSGTPYRANLFVNLHAAGSGSASYDEALRDNESDLNGGATDWKQVERDEHWDIIQGRYTVNMLNEATWRLKYRDPSKRVSLLWQVYQTHYALADAKAALVKMAESVKRVREPEYAEIADRPRREAVANARKADAAFAWLAARGYGTLIAGVPVTREGITVELRVDPERRLMLYKPIASRPGDQLPAYVSHGWRDWTAGKGWEDHMPNGDYYPSPGTRAMLDDTQSRPGPHHFLIRTIRLDEPDEADYHIADFFAFVAAYRG